MVLIMELHLALRTMQNFSHSLVQVPLGQLLLRDEPISGINVDLGEKQHKPISHIELVLIIKEFFGVVELLPLGLMMLPMMLMMILMMIIVMVVVVGIFFSMVMVARDLREFLVVFVEVHSLPLLVLLVALHLRHHGIKGHRVVVVVVVVAEVVVGIVVLKVVLLGEGEVGVDLQPPVAMAAGGVGMVVMVVAVPWRKREE